MVKILSWIEGKLFLCGPCVLPAQCALERNGLSVEREHSGTFQIRVPPALRGFPAPPGLGTNLWQGLPVALPLQVALRGLGPRWTWTDQVLSG